MILSLILLIHHHTDLTVSIAFCTIYDLGSYRQFIRKDHLLLYTIEKISFWAGPSFFVIYIRQPLGNLFSIHAGWSLLKKCHSLFLFQSSLDVPGKEETDHRWIVSKTRWNSSFCRELQIKETNNVMPSYKVHSIFDKPLWALKKSSVADWTRVLKTLQWKVLQLNYIWDKYIYRVIIIRDTLWNKTLWTEIPW